MDKERQTERKTQGDRERERETKTKRETKRQIAKETGSQRDSGTLVERQRGRVTEEAEAQRGT
jgi:hypothetical protein